MATPSEYEYYKETMKSLIKANNEGGKWCNEKIWQAVINLRAELNVEHKRNINNISCDDLYQSPMKNKYVSTISDYVYNEFDEHVDTILDSSKQVDARNEPIKDTHIVKETLLQNNSTDVPENIITELKDEELKETSVTQKGNKLF